MTETPETVGTCAGGCGRQLVAATRWDPLDRQRRRQLVGYARHCARQLCRGCYSHARNTDTLTDHERRSVSAADVADEWEHAAEDMRGLSRNERVRQLAPRLGMTHAALDKAVDRLVARGEVAA